MTLPKVSVITVVFNARHELEKTLSSIRAQQYPNIEYLIIDGGSKDGTLEIISQNKDLISYWVSEPDKGLYDAMNKGLQAATGDYVWFINAGDQIYSPDTLNNIFDIRQGPGQSPTPSDNQYADIYYGDTMIVDENYSEIGLRRLRPPKNLTWKSFRWGMLVCHQSILVRRNLADLYDLSLPHSADFDWVIKALKKTNRIENTGMILAAFLDGGQSKKTIQPSLTERLRSMASHYGLLPSLLRHIPITIRFFLYVVKNKRF